MDNSNINNINLNKHITIKRKYILTKKSKNENTQGIKTRGSGFIRSRD